MLDWLTGGSTDRVSYKGVADDAIQRNNEYIVQKEVLRLYITVLEQELSNRTRPNETVRTPREVVRLNDLIIDEMNNLTPEDLTPIETYDMPGMEQ